MLHQHLQNTLILIMLHNHIESPHIMLTMLYKHLETTICDIIMLHNHIQNSHITLTMLHNYTKLLCYTYNVTY